jgi:trehalose 6-phosphate synthase
VTTAVLARESRVETRPHVEAIVNRLTGGRRLIVASNRGPVEHVFDGGGRVQQRSGCGGVSIALSAIARHAPVTWIASAMTDADRAVSAGGHDDGSPFERLVPRLVAPEQEAYKRFYNLVCNPVLWFLQHGQWAHVDWQRSVDQIREGWTKGYVPVNRTFAHRISRELDAPDSGRVVMFQDYHLYLAPSYVRAAAPHSILSHFVHIPWPSTDAWANLPREMTRSILGGLLACDLVGFQTPDSVHNFLITCADFLRGVTVNFREGSVTLDGHRTLVRDYPISPDVPSLRTRTESPAARLHRMKLAAGLHPYTIVRVDRMDPAKNILAGFQAFDLLLDANPEFRGQVQFLAFLVPTRQEVPEYRSYAEKVLGLVQEINQRWGGATWQPIRVFYEHNYDQALAGLALYDVLLVNSSSDGMNLVSKEGAIVNKRDGVIVLSQAAGAFRELGHAALPVEPADLPGTARSLAVALAMPAEERRRRAAALRAAVEANDFSRWLERQVEDLHDIAEQRAWAWKHNTAIESGRGKPFRLVETSPKHAIGTKGGSR